MLSFSFVFAFTCVKFYSFTVLEVSGADGLVSDTISWMAKRSLSRCRGLLMPISRWISVSDSADMMAPLFTLARQAATYHAGMPTHSWRRSSRHLMRHRQHLLRFAQKVVVKQQKSGSQFKSIYYQAAAGVAT